MAELPDMLRRIFCSMHASVLLFTASCSARSRVLTVTAEVGQGCCQLTHCICPKARCSGATVSPCLQAAGGAEDCELRRLPCSVPMNLPKSMLLTKPNLALACMLQGELRVARCGSFHAASH